MPSIAYGDLAERASAFLAVVAAHVLQRRGADIRVSTPVRAIETSSVPSLHLQSSPTPHGMTLSHGCR
jgi:hypothetical protein